MATVALFGSMGFAIALFSNSVRKLPLMRRPWEHFMYAGAGTWIGSKYQEFKDNNEVLLEEVLAERKAADIARQQKLAARKAAAQHTG